MGITEGLERLKKIADKHNLNLRYALDLNIAINIFKEELKQEDKKPEIDEKLLFDIGIDHEIASRPNPHSIIRQSILN
jgi:hypothetical protein